MQSGDNVGAYPQLLAGGKSSQKVLAAPRTLYHPS